MKDKDIWLLLFGRGWVTLQTIEEEHDDVFTRLARDKKLEVNENFECVRLKETQ